LNTEMNLQWRNHFLNFEHQLTFLIKHDVSAAGSVSFFTQGKHVIRRSP
jgi:hypothetical protein